MLIRTANYKLGMAAHISQTCGLHFITKGRPSIFVYVDCQWCKDSSSVVTIQISYWLVLCILCDVHVDGDVFVVDLLNREVLAFQISSFIKERWSLPTFLSSASSKDVWRRDELWLPQTLKPTCCLWKYLELITFWKYYISSAIKPIWARLISITPGLEHRKFQIQNFSCVFSSFFYVSQVFNSH